MIIIDNYRAAIKFSISSILLSIPTLRRIAHFAISGLIFIAAKTCDKATRPEEQADPADKQKPFKSSLINSVSFFYSEWQNLMC